MPPFVEEPVCNQQAASLAPTFTLSASSESFVEQIFFMWCKSQNKHIYILGAESEVLQVFKQWLGCSIIDNCKNPRRKFLANSNTKILGIHLFKVGLFSQLLQVVALEPLTTTTLNRFFNLCLILQLAFPHDNCWPVQACWTYDDIVYDVDRSIRTFSRW